MIAGVAFGVAPGTAYLTCRMAGLPRRRFCLQWAVNAGCGLVIALFLRDWAGAGMFALSVLAALLWDWWNRESKRAAKVIGEKSRAVLAAVVERAREAGTPVPQGVRA